MVTVPRKNAEANVVLLNGSSTPAAREMRAGQRYRLRFINVHTSRPSMRMRLLRESTLLEWRALAKDGMDAAGGPADLPGRRKSRWETARPTISTSFHREAGDIRLDVTNPWGSCWFRCRFASADPVDMAQEL